VAVTDPLRYRLAMALAQGATTTHLAEKPGSAPEILSVHPDGLDAVFDCSGEQAALDEALALLKPGGALIVVGIPETDRVSFDINVMRRKELRIENVRRQNDCTPEAIELISSGRVKLDAIITHDFEARDSSAAFELVANYRDGASKALIHFG
jgi:threonine dehydrogenase-like Zn-dependent dehydrogenase